MKTRYIFYSLLMLLATLLPTSCSHEEDFMESTTTDGEKITFTIGVDLAGASKAESRAFGNTNYNFENLYVAVFDVTDDGNYLKEFVEATPQKTNDNDNCWVYQVTLTNSATPCRVHLIANYPGLTMGFGEEGQLIGRLETLAQNDGHDVYWNFVDMNNGINETTDSQLEHVPLIRNYAKVQLSFENNLNEKFQFIAYGLYNVPTKGTVAAYNSSATGNKFAKFIENGNALSYNQITNAGYLGNEAYNDGNLYTNVWMENGSTAPYYLYERKNKNASNPLCMIIEGTYEGATTYYKLAFVNAQGEYYNMLRNFVYTMHITSINGAGYSTIDEALREPACNNISGDAIAEDFTNISNGTNQLYVSTTFMMFTKRQTAELYYKYISGINSTEPTISNGSVTIEGTAAGAVLESAATIASADETSGQYEGWRKVTITTHETSANAKTQQLVFKAGGVQRKITLMLNQPYEGMVVNAYDGESNDITDKVVPAQANKLVKVDITLPANIDIPESLFPLRLFISSAKNTIFPQYGSNMPTEVQNGKYGFIKEVSYTEAYTISENADGSKTKTPNTITCEFLTNCANNATTVLVENEYFASASDAFFNTENGGSGSGSLSDDKKTLTIKSQIIDVQQDGFSESENLSLRYPYKIDNNQTVDVDVTLGSNNSLGKIYIKRDGDSVKIVSDYTFTNINGFKLNDVLTFTFLDRYKYNDAANSWDNTERPYTATCTVEELLNGTTLHFTHQY